jgi:hypothetical protein
MGVFAVLEHGVHVHRDRLGDVGVGRDPGSAFLVEQFGSLEIVGA